VGINTGGIAEMFWGYPRPDCSPDREYALLKGRRGFVRLAIKHGLQLVPVFVFGSSKIFKRYFNLSLSLPSLFLCFLLVIRLETPTLVERVSRWLKSAVMVFWGRFGLPVPFPIPLLYAVGKAIQVPIHWILIRFRQYHSLQLR